MATELGKRYRCTKCGTEALCVKAGSGTPSCCGQDMELVQPKPVPSSD
jgi:desulfoferrodoxin-like iron-binding protein